MPLPRRASDLDRDNRSEDAKPLWQSAGAVTRLAKKLELDAYVLAEALDADVVRIRYVRVENALGRPELRDNHPNATEAQLDVMHRKSLSTELGGWETQVLDALRRAGLSQGKATALVSRVMDRAANGDGNLNDLLRDEVDAIGGDVLDNYQAAERRSALLDQRQTTASGEETEEPVTVTKNDLDAAMAREVVALREREPSLSRAQATTRILKQRPELYRLRDDLPAGDGRIAKAAMTVGDVVRLAKAQTEPSRPSLKRLADVALSDAARVYAREHDMPLHNAAPHVLRSDDKLRRLAKAAVYPQATQPITEATLALEALVPGLTAAVVTYTERPDVIAQLETAR